MNPDKDFYKPGGAATVAAPPLPQAGVTSASSAPPADSNVSWTATEYIDHYHGPGWYGALILGTLALAGVIYFWTKDYFATGTILALGIVVAVAAARQPRQVTYEISSSGLRVGEKLYAYGQFKSFTLIREGDFISVDLAPVKRFALPVSAYFTAQDQEMITNALGRYLPYEERRPHKVDQLSHRLRF